MKVFKHISATLLASLFLFLIVSCAIKQETVSLKVGQQYYRICIPKDYQHLHFKGYHEDGCEMYCYSFGESRAVVYIYPDNKTLNYSAIFIGPLVYLCYGRDIFYNRYHEEPSLEGWANQDSTSFKLFGAIIPDSVDYFHQNPDYSVFTKKQLDSIFNRDTIMIGGYNNMFVWKEQKIKGSVIIGYYNVPKIMEKRFDRCLQSVEQLNE